MSCSSIAAGSTWSNVIRSVPMAMLALIVLAARTLYTVERVDRPVNAGAEDRKPVRLPVLLVLAGRVGLRLPGRLSEMAGPVLLTHGAKVTWDLRGFPGVGDAFRGNPGGGDGATARELTHRFGVVVGVAVVRIRLLAIWFAVLQPHVEHSAKAHCLQAC